MPLVTRQANTGNLLVQATEPADPKDGDVWTDLGQNPPIVKVNDAGTFRPMMQAGTFVQGDTVFANANNTLDRLPKGTSLQLFRMNSGATIPEWGDAAAEVTITENSFALTTTFTTTSAAFVDTDIQVTLANRSGGFGALMVMMPHENSGANINAYQLDDDTSNIQEWAVGGMPAGVDATTHCTAVVALDGSLMEIEAGTDAGTLSLIGAAADNTKRCKMEVLEVS